MKNITFTETPAHAKARRQLVAHLRDGGIKEERVLHALQIIPRHFFMEQESEAFAYENNAFPIQCGQTISQPYIVAQMTSVLCDGRDLKRVLEVGTGSGYQAAVLSQVAESVYSIERIKALYELAETRLKALGVNNVHLLYGDGYAGWPEFAPYDGILVTAAPLEVPEALLAQLADGGRMIVPVGVLGDQRLMLITRQKERFVQKMLEGVRFVPLLPGVH